SVNNAVDVAKESADIILLQNDLRILEEGILEGRKTFGNTMKYVMMGVSSNFGNMFSVAGASLFLPFLPMTATQILLNNLLYDFSQFTITTDNVDSEYVEKPKKWDISFIRRFMVIFGPISSVFDFLTFFIMLFVFIPHLPLSVSQTQKEQLFQTAWFLESLSTQTFVIFVIRTRRTPFYKSKPSMLLLLSSLSIVAFALILPYTPIGGLFHFVQPPFTFFPVLAGLIGTYLTLTEAVKKWFYKRYAYRLEQVLTRPRAGVYLTKNAMLIQDIVAIICLHPKDEISIDTLLDDLARIVPYPLDPDKVGHNIQHLRRAGLISINWRKRTIKREKPIRDYVTKQVVTSEFWPKISKEWQKISDIIQEKYEKANTEYLNLLPP
ncbi:MAG: cation transporting ATPase C-terminal domain-containing protein, partial [Candidatus Bathyarchaeia archaeon]